MYDTVLKQYIYMRYVLELICTDAIG